MLRKYKIWKTLNKIIQKGHKKTEASTNSSKTKVWHKKRGMSYGKVTPSHSNTTSHYRSNHSRSYNHSGPAGTRRGSHKLSVNQKAAPARGRCRVRKRVHFFEIQRLIPKKCAGADKSDAAGPHEDYLPCTSKSTGKQKCQ